MKKPDKDKLYNNGVFCILPWMSAYVNTDSTTWSCCINKEMQNEGIKFGLDAPFLRPEELATDKASAIDVWKHAFIESEKYYKLVLLLRQLFLT